MFRGLLILAAVLAASVSDAQTGRSPLRPTKIAKTAPTVPIVQSQVEATGTDTTVYFGPDAKQAPTGKFWRLVFHADGATPTITMALDTGDATPVPTPAPTPDTLTDRAKVIRDAAVGATADPKRTETAGQLAELYRQLAAKITGKSITGQELAAFAVKYGTDSLLSGKGSAVTTAWQPTRDLFGTQWAALLNKGADDAAYATLLNEAAAGLDASVPKELRGAIDIQAILAIIKMIMEIISLFS